MYSPAITLGLLGLASAIPSHPIARRQAPLYPPSSSTQAFTLVANQTDLCADLPQVNGWVLMSYHTGAGESLAVLFDPAQNYTGNIFYTNVTSDGTREGSPTTVTDLGTPPAPYSIIVQNQTQFDNSSQVGEHDTYINVGYGTPEVGITGFPQPVATLFAPLAHGWAACNNTVLYSGRKAIVLQPVYPIYTNATGGYDYQANVPAGCAPVTMMPQCATLNTLPTGSISNHDNVGTVSCYEDVAGIDWTVYSAS